MKKWFEYLNIVWLCISTVTLIGLQMKTEGWILLAIGLLGLFLCRKQFVKDLFLIYTSIGILGLTAISTDISLRHMFGMGVALSLAVGIPYFISRFIYKDYLVRFQFHHGRSWYKTEIAYIAVTAIVAYLLLPFYLKDTNAHLNWTVEPGAFNISKLFVGTNVLGIWDELFFISTVLGILRRYLSFTWANLVQSILFTSFLYELGFTGWGFIVIFIFALTQGYVFKKTESLLYIISIHLTLDFILFLALINAHHQSWIPVFITH